MTLEQLDGLQTMSSEYEGNPPLWINKKMTDFKKEFYVNNARILESGSNYIAKIRIQNMHKTQVNNLKGNYNLKKINNFL